jgi:hypothetical protein
VPELREDHATAGAIHVTPRGIAGPNLLAMILFEKFGYRREQGVTMTPRLTLR